MKKVFFILALFFCLSVSAQTAERFFIIDAKQKKTLDSLFLKVNFSVNESRFEAVQLADSTKWILPESIKESPAFRKFCESGRAKYLFDQIFLYVPLRTLAGSEIKVYDSSGAVSTGTVSGAKK